MDSPFVQQKPIDEVTDCEEQPSCIFSWQELNRMRTSIVYVKRSWVPRWLWIIASRFLPRPWLSKGIQGDLTPDGILSGAEHYQRMMKRVEEQVVAEDTNTEEE